MGSSSLNIPEYPERLSLMIETNARLRDIVGAQVKQLHMHAFNIKHFRNAEGGRLLGNPEVYSVIGPLIHMAAISGLSLLKLTEEIDLNVKDAFPVARSIVESVVNTCYVMAEEDEAGRAIRHAEFKSLRDLGREWRAGSNSFSVKWGGKLSAEAEARLKLLTTEFTTSKGRERDWTDKSLRQRLDSASLKFDSRSLLMLSGAAFNVYSTASEVVHASYFSALYFFGLTDPGSRPPGNMNDFKLTLSDHQFSVLLSAMLAYTSFVECFSSYSMQPKLKDEAREALRQMGQLPAVVASKS